ncbi:hypothetical protein DFP72DRAFT_837178, partial [Ephemerocybe angulata]
LDNLHSLLAALWLQPWEDDSNPLPDPTLCFLALFLMKDDGVFLQPTAVTPVLAKITRMIYLTIVRQMYKLKEAGAFPNLRLALDSLTPYIFESSGLSTLEVLRYHQNFATTLATQTKGLPRIVWHRSFENDFTTLMYAGQIVSMENLKALFSALERKAIKIWEEEVLLGIEERVDIGVPKDSFTNTSKGYSFLSNTDNHFHRYQKCLGRRFLQDPVLMKKFYSIDPITGVATLNAAACHKWLSSLARLEAIQMALAEMRGGGPIRLAEMASTVVCNIETRTRNLYAYGPHILLVCQYNKTTHNHQKDAIIPHALSAFDADMLVQIHALARPFAQFLVAALYPDEPHLARQYCEMLFMDCLQPFDPATISQLMGNESKIIFGWAMTIACYRHIAIAFKNALKIVILFDPDEGPEPDQYTDVQALQGGHSLGTERRIYGLSAELLHGVSDDTVHLYIRSSRDWQQSFEVVPAGTLVPYRKASMNWFQTLVKNGTVKLTPRHLPGADDSRTISELYQIVHRSIAQKEQSHKATMDELARIWVKLEEVQAQVAQSHRHVPPPPPTKIPTFEPPLAVVPYQSTPAPAASHPVVSQSHLHPSLLPSPSATPPELQGLTPSAMPHDRVVGSHPVPSVLLPSDMLHSVQRLYGTGANWSDRGQRDATEALLKLEKDVFVILRTGGGKTAVAVLPSLVEESITVIVIPFVSLLEDWVRRLTEWNIVFEVYTQETSPSLGCSGAKIILVSSDRARLGQWKQDLARLDATRPVARIIFDEAHVWFMDLKFREQAMSLPSTLRQFPTQFVLISATIPPALEEVMSKDFAMSASTTIRNHPHRPELKYIIIRNMAGIPGMIAHFKSHLDNMKTSRPWSNRDRWIIFVTTYLDGYEVAKSLGVEFYHSHNPEYPLTHQERKAIYERWSSGGMPGMVATTAVSVGTDYSHVRLTAHFNPPFDMTSLVQQTSRAGRDGAPADCLVLCPIWTRPRTHTGEDEIRGITALKELLEIPPNSPPPCVRGAIGRAMEGVEIACIDLDSRWQPCSGCDPGWVLGFMEYHLLL